MKLCGIWAMQEGNKKVYWRDNNDCIIVMIWWCYSSSYSFFFQQREDRKVQADSFKTPWPSEQHLQHLPQTHSGMSEYPPQSPQQASSMSNNLNSPASSSQTSLFNPPQPPLDMNNFYFSQQHWESSSIHTQETQITCESNSSQHITAQAQLAETQSALSRIESSSQQTQTFSHQDQKQTSIPLSIQQGNTTAGNNVTAVSGCTKLTLGSNKNPSPDVKTSFSTFPCQVSHSIQVSKATAGLTEDTQAPNNNVLDNNAVLSSKPFTFEGTDGYQDTKANAPYDFTSPSSTSGRPDITKSFFLAGQLHGYQPADCLTSGLRPVQSCQDYTEDTSSSDDEGKLIIEL